MKAQEASSTQPTMATNDNRIARYGNLVIYERSGVLTAEFRKEKHEEDS